MYALELQQNHLEPLNSMTQSSLYSFAELFSFIISEQQEKEQAAADFRRGWVADQQKGGGWGEMVGSGERV